MTCQKVRAALSQTGATFNDRDFFKEKFTAEELRGLAGGQPLSQLFSARSPSIAKLGLDPAAMDEAQMLEWMLKEPRLIRRPFMVIDGRLVIQPKPAELAGLVS